MSKDREPISPPLLMVIWSKGSERLGRCYTLDPSGSVITIGRSSESTIVVASDAVSRRHAHIEAHDDGFWLVDNQSQNGTYVNGEPVKRALLQRQDKIRIGETIFKFILDEDDRGIVETEYTITPFDGLTQVFNRRHLYEQIGAELRAPRPSERPLALALFDINHFRQINDTHGHLAGDQILRELASLIRARLRPDVVLARCAGDKFAVFCPGQDLQETMTSAEQIRREIESQCFSFQGRAILLTVSFGVVQATEETRSADDLLRSAEDKLRAERRGDRRLIRMPSRGSDAAHIESTLGLCASRGSRTIDAGAGGDLGILIVADGMGGHCTGWLGARLAARILVERLVVASAGAYYVGAAAAFPDEWGWAGFMQSRQAAEQAYEECLACLGDRASLPRDAASLFSEIDRILSNIPEPLNIRSLLVGCLAATIEGPRVRLTHAGVCRALLLRAGADRLESLLVEHYLHLFLSRFLGPGAVPSPTIPQNVVCNGLGALKTSNVGVDQLDIELWPGDLLLLCSGQLDISDEEVARLAKTALSEGRSLHDLARLIERQSSVVYNPDESHRAKDVAFALVLAKPSSS